MDQYNFDGQMIRNQLQLSKDLEFVSQHLDVLETQIQTLISGQQLIMGTINRTKKKNKRSAQPKLPLQKSPRQKNKQSSTSDVSKLLHLPEALQKNIRRFTENISFKSTSIPDDLISMECLSEDECNTIISKPSEKDQTRLLIKKIKTRGPEVTEKFLTIVEKDQPELVQEVYKTLDEIWNQNKDKPVCAICLMQYNVDLKDIADYLWERNIITDNTFGEIVESESLHRSRPLIWSSIMSSLNDFAEAGEAKSILISALSPKYDHIVKYISQTSDRLALSCCCCTKTRRVKQRPLVSEFGSQTDISTTSSRLPKVLDEDSFSEDSRSVVSSQGLSSSNLLSYELPEIYESMGNISFNFKQPEIQSSVIDSTTGSQGNESTAGNAHYLSGITKYFASQAELTDAQHAGSQDGSTPLLMEESKRITEEETHERQELKHSVSTISNTSTIRAVHSMGSVGAEDNTISVDEVDDSQDVFQSELKEDDNNSDSYLDNTDQEMNVGDENTEDIQSKLMLDNVGKEKECHTEVADMEGLSAEATYKILKSDNWKSSDASDEADEAEDNQVSSTSPDTVRQKQKSLFGDATNIPHKVEAGNIEDDNQVSSTTTDNENLPEMKQSETLNHTHEATASRQSEDNWSSSKTHVFTQISKENEQQRWEEKQEKQIETSDEESANIEESKKT